MRAEVAYALSQRTDPRRARASLMMVLNQISNEAAMGHTCCKSFTYLIEETTIEQLRALGYRVETQADYDEEDRTIYYFIDWSPSRTKPRILGQP